MSIKSGKKQSVDDDSKGKEEPLNLYIESNLKTNLAHQLKLRTLNLSGLAERFAEKLNQEPDFADAFWKIEQSARKGKVGKKATSISLTDSAKEYLKNYCVKHLGKYDRKSISYLIEKLMKCIQSGDISFENLSINTKQIISDRLNDSVEISVEIKLEPDTSSFEPVSLTSNLVPSSTANSTELALDSSSKSHQASFLGEIEVGFAGANKISPLPSSPGVFFVVFIKDQYIQENTPCFSSSNMHLCWNSLIQDNSVIANQHESYGEMAFFIWCTCGDEFNKDILMLKLQEYWKGYFKENKFRLVSEAGFYKNWSSLRYFYNYFNQARFSVIRNEFNGESEPKKTRNMCDLAFIILMIFWIFLVALVNFTPLNYWIDSYEGSKIGESLVSQMSAYLIDIIAVFIMFYAVLQRFRQKRRKNVT